MNDDDREKLLEANLWGSSPGEVFRARVLLDSTAAFARARRSRVQWRFAVRGAAAVLLAGVSFLLGRYSVPAGEPQPMPGPVVADGSATVVVSDEVVAWLEAARLFRQLGMEDRMARAVDRANQLLPRDRATLDSETRQVFVAGVGEKKRIGAPDAHPSAENTSRILAHSLGD